jgi:hypothetical protein
MRRKILASIATFIIILGGVVSPTLGFVFSGFDTPHAYAQSDATSSGTATDTGELQDSPSTELDCGLNLGCSIFVVILQMGMFVPVLVSTATGLVFDFSIWYSLQSSTYTKFDGQVGDEGIVVTGWKLIRDFTNLIFIFALFVIAFTLILNLDERGEGAPMGLDPKRTIARVIIMALLVNFSFFIGRTIIDVTNVFGLAFYNKLTAAPIATNSSSELSGSIGSKAVGDPASFYTNWGGMRSISTNIIGQVNPQQLLLSNGEIKGSGWFIISYDWSVYILLLLLTVMSFFFNLFLVYIFGSIAFLFFTRTIGLYLGVITSPIAFVSWTVPALQKMNFIGFDDWAKQFFGLAFMAPVFLFFLYIIVQFFDISFISGGSGYLVLGAQIAIKLAIIGVLLIYSRKIAKDLSGKIGDAAGGIITGIAGAGAMFAGAALTGGAGGMLAMGKQMAKNTWSSAKTTAVSTVGKATFGEEKYAAMEQRWKINGKALSFENLRKNPRSVFNAATKIASAGGEPGVFAAWRAGRAAPRKFDIEQAKKRKEEYEKKEKYNKAWEPYTSPDGAQRRKRLKEIEKELENHKKDLDENIITRQEYKDKAKALNQEKRDLLLPEDKRKEVQAERALKTEKDRQTPENKELDTKTTNAKNKLDAVEKRLADSVTAIADANTRLAQISKDRTAIESDITAKSKATAAAKTQRDADISSLNTEQAAILTKKQPLDAKLKDLDAQIASAPKAGFGAQDHLARLQQERDALAQQKRVADTELADVNARIQKTENSYQAVADAEKQARQKKTVLDNEEQAVTTKLTTSEATKQSLEAERTATLAEKDALEQKKAANQATISTLTDALNQAKGATKQNKEKKELEKEIFIRDVDKAEARNREKNNERLEDLKKKLAAIHNGGTPPPTP